MVCRVGEVEEGMLSTVGRDEIEVEVNWRAGLGGIEGEVG